MGVQCATELREAVDLADDEPTQAQDARRQDRVEHPGREPLERRRDVTTGLARPRGHLRVNTGSAYAKHRLIPRLPDFLARYPEIRPTEVGY